MINLPDWLQELQMFMGDRLQVVPQEGETKLTRQIKSPSSNSAQVPSRFEFPSSGFVVIHWLTQDDPLRTICELLIRAYQEQDIEKNDRQSKLNPTLAALTHLLSGNYQSAEKWQQETKQIGDLNSLAGYFLCLQFEESHAAEESGSEASEAFLTELASLHEGMQFARYTPDLQTDVPVSAASSNSWAVFLPELHPAKEDELVRELKSWVDLVSSELFLRLRIGIGSKCQGLESAYSCLQQSLFALLQGCRFRPEDRVYRYNDLGIIHLLAGLSQTASDRFLDNLHFMHRKADLTPELKETAWAFLKNDLNVTETARNLYLHRNSLMYRLERILEITGLDLRKFEDAVLMWLCLHLLHESN